MLRHIFVDDAHQLVDEKGVPARNGMAGRRSRFEPPLHFRPAAVERGLQCGYDRRPGLGRMLRDQRLDFGSELAAIDDGALVGDVCVAQLAAYSLA